MKQHLTYKILSVAPALLIGAALACARIANPLSLTVAIAAAIACAAAAVLAFCLRKRYADDLPNRSAAEIFASSATGLLLLVCAAFSVYCHSFAPLTERLAVPNATVLFLAILFSLLGALYFLLSAFAPSLFANRGVRLLWAMAPVLYCAFRILSDFIATGTMPLANGGGYHILGMIATMLFLLSEAKLIAKKGKPFAYLACGQIAIILNAAYNIPLFVSPENASALDLLHGAMFLMFSLYIAFRLLTLPRAEQQADPQTEEQA